MNKVLSLLCKLLAISPREAERITIDEVYDFLSDDKLEETLANRAFSAWIRAQS